MERTALQITFEEWLNICDEKDLCELVDGKLIEKSVFDFSIAKAYRWFSHLLQIYVEEHQMGKVLGSLVAVRINTFCGRMPDLFFVREQNRAIIQQKATYGTPDLVIEFRSPNDYASDIAALETDYRAILVPEIVFVDMRSERIRVLRLEAGHEYVEENLTSGELLTLHTMDNLILPTDWILREPRPNRRETLERLLQATT